MLLLLVTTSVARNGTVLGEFQWKVLPFLFLVHGPSTITVTMPSASVPSDGVVASAVGHGGAVRGGAAWADPVLMMHCLLAMLCAASLMIAVQNRGLTPCLGNCMESRSGYSFCEAFQDFRCAMSFSLGALACHMFDAARSGNSTMGEAAARSQSSTATERIQNEACQIRMPSCLFW